MRATGPDPAHPMPDTRDPSRIHLQHLRSGLVASRCGLQAAAREPFGVTLGACLGHALCTGIAVLGGKLLASSISERTVLLVGGVLFCIFSVLALLSNTGDSPTAQA